MKRFISAVAFVCTAILASAQVSLGVHAGAGLNKVTYPLSDFSYKNMTGLMIGVMYDYQVCEMLDVQAELNYSQRGYRDKICVSDNDFMAEYKCKSSYLELPVVAKFYPFKQIGLNIQAGPQISVLLNRNLSTDNDMLETEYLKGKDNKVDYGLNIGLGYEEQRCCLDFRYYFGMAKTYKDMNKHQNRGFSLTLGYYF